MPAARLQATVVLPSPGCGLVTRIVRVVSSGVTCPRRLRTRRYCSALIECGALAIVSSSGSPLSGSLWASGIMPRTLICPTRPMSRGLRTLVSRISRRKARPTARPRPSRTHTPIVSFRSGKLGDCGMIGWLAQVTSSCWRLLLLSNRLVWSVNIRFS